MKALWHTYYSCPFNAIQTCHQALWNFFLPFFVPVLLSAVCLRMSAFLLGTSMIQTLRFGEALPVNSPQLISAEFESCRIDAEYLSITHETVFTRV